MNVDQCVQMERLKQLAEESANWHEHDLGEWTLHPKKNVSWANCIDCRMSAIVNINPLPNEIDIGGPAIALNCTKE